jgi:hypothetical protein
MRQVHVDHIGSDVAPGVLPGLRAVRQPQVYHMASFGARVFRVVELITSKAFLMDNTFLGTTDNN